MTIKTTLAAVGLAAMLAASGVIYPQTCIVVDVDVAADVVTIETAMGYRFEFGGVEDWIEGDLCACIFYNAMTDNTITDDQILSVRYSGTAEMFIQIDHEAEAWS